MSTDEGSGQDLSTMRGKSYPAIRQFTVVLENRCGQLLDLVRRFDSGRVKIVALSIVESGECALVRLLLSHPEQGREILDRTELQVIESDLIGIVLPDSRQPMLDICMALLQAEINIHQTYPLLVRIDGRPCVAIQVDNLEVALETLASKNFTMVQEDDLKEEW